jgi:hypothetical protein
MTDESGADVSIDAAWRATMMGNAARDPYWRASVRVEGLLAPDYQAVIEDKCATCHTPMARFTARAQESPTLVLEEGFLDPGSALHTLALDGVSCTLCHQIEEQGFGALESFSGGFSIDDERPPGERIAFGPFPVTPNQAQVMSSVSGFIPVESSHVERSELCATCHTLYTPYVDATGQIAGEFPEQTPYLEWLNSDYREVEACQDCHMPQADGAVQLSTTGGPPRSPFFRHLFAGGNAYMLDVFRQFGGDIGTMASSAEFATKMERTAEQLRERTATVTLEDATVSDDELAAVVRVEVLTGHKFPTGFPSRRAWLHLVVEDADGQVVFESGAVTEAGAIVGNDNDADPSAFEVHYLEITAPDQVQIYESIMRDTEGEVTTVLLRGAGYVKDNRLLPVGFDPAAADADFAVYGLATEDEDFVGGGDRIRYVIDLGGATGPFNVTAELLFQSISFRWVEKMRGQDAEEAQRFLSYVDQVPNRPHVVATATVEVTE